MSDSSSSAAASTEPVIPPVPAGHTQLYLKNLSFTTTEESLSSHVTSLVGKPHSVNIVTTKRPGKFQGRSRGFGFVTVVSAQAATLISKLNGTTFEGRELAVVEAKPRDPNAPRPARQPRQPKQKTDAGKAEGDSSSSSSSSAPAAERKKPERKTFPDATQLYVNNLSFATTTEELAALFQTKTGAAPLDVEIVKSRFGKFKDRSRGFGFVFVGNSSVAAALALNGTALNERDIGVQVAKPADESTEAEKPRRRSTRRRRPRADGEAATTDAAPADATTDNGEAPDNRRRRGGPGGRGRRRRGGRGGATAAEATTSS